MELSARCGFSRFVRLSGRGRAQEFRPEAEEPVLSLGAQQGARARTQHGHHRDLRDPALYRVHRADQHLRADQSLGTERIGSPCNSNAGRLVQTVPSSRGATLSLLYIKQIFHNFALLYFYFLLYELYTLYKFIT